MGASQRRKGAAAEREVCQLLREQLGVEVGRNLEQTRSGGCDIWLEVAGKPMAIEVKRQEKTSVPQWLDQVMAVVGAECHSVCFRPSRRQWMVAMPLETWLFLLRESGVK